MQETAAFVRQKLGQADVAIILGSGLGDFVKTMKHTTELSYDEIPNMPQVTIAGHAGKLIAGSIKGVRVFCFAGRFHSYEGIQWSDVCFQVQMMAMVGCRLYIVTNATGGLLDGMRPGALCLLNDHCRLLSRTDPLKKIEINQDLLERSRSSATYWNSKMIELTQQIAHEKKIQLFKGPYVWTSGPSFETPLEVRIAKNFGGACVGMSTVPEIVAAHAYGMPVLGISMISNLGAGLSSNALTHQEVLESTKLSVPNLMTLLEETIASIPQVFNMVDQVGYSANHMIAIRSVSKLSQLSRSTSSAASFITTHFNVKSLSRAMFGFFALENSILLNQLDNFPSNSIAGSKGQLTVKNDQLVILMGDHDGFSLEEATYLSLLLCHLSITNVSISLHGERITTKSNRLISDLINFTSDTRPLHYVHQLALHERIAGNRILEQEDGICYIAYDGPSRVSNLEKHISEEIGADAIGTTSVSIIYILRYLGLSVTAHLVQDDHEMQEIATQDTLLMPSSIDFSLIDIDMTSPSRLNTITYEQVHEAASFVSSQVVPLIDNNVSQDNGGPLTAIIDFNLNLPLLKDSRVELIRQISLSSVPNYNHYASSIKDAPTLQLVRFTHNHTETAFIYVVSNVSHSFESFDTSCATFIVRLFQQLGVRNIYMTSSFVSATRDIGNDTVIALSDHINLTGENPLTGHNEHRWGDRFFDMSFTYSNDIMLPPLSDISDQRLRAVKCLFTNHVRTLQSKTLIDNSCRVFDSQVLGDVGCMEVITVRHSVGKVRSAVLGIAVDAEQIHIARASDHQSQQIIDVLIAYGVLLGKMH